MAYSITCSDAQHASRSAQPGWQTILGTSSVPQKGGEICAACAKAKLDADAAAENTGIAAAEAAITKLITRLSSGGAFTRAELVAAIRRLIANG